MTESDDKPELDIAGLINELERDIAELINELDKSSAEDKEKTIRFKNALNNLLKLAKILITLRIKYDHQGPNITYNNNIYYFNKYNYREMYLNIDEAVVKGLKTSLGGKRISKGKSNKVAKKPIVYQKKQSVYKEIFGKQMKIYKMPDSRKEYVKYKGELHPISEYKSLIKQRYFLSFQGHMENP